MLITISLFNDSIYKIGEGWNNFSLSSLVLFGQLFESLLNEWQVCLYARVAYCLQHVATSSRCLAVRTFINDLFLQAKKGNNEVDKSIGNVLYGIATKLKKQLAQHEPLLVQYAAKRKIVSNDQLDGKLLINLNMS